MWRDDLNYTGFLTALEVNAPNSMLFEGQLYICKDPISNKIRSEVLGAHEFLGDTIQPSAENYNGTYCIGGYKD